MRKILAVVLLAVASLAVQAQATQTASLKWTEPTTTIPVGFRVYQIALTSTQASCPVFSQTTWKLAQDSIPATQPNWVVPNLLTGTTYCFAVTAYNTFGTGTGGGGESGPSNLLMLPDPTSGGGTAGTPPSPTTLNGTRQ